MIVGHSLGSVIAADLLQRLPAGLEVVGMVTIGSPLASGRFDVDKLRESMQEPPTNLAWWANFWNVLDPVAAHRGLSSVFNWMLDFRIGTGFNHHVHDAEAYLSHDAVAEAVGFAFSDRGPPKSSAWTTVWTSNWTRLNSQPWWHCATPIC